MAQDNAISAEGTVKKVRLHVDVLLSFPERGPVHGEQFCYMSSNANCPFCSTAVVTLLHMGTPSGQDRPAYSLKLQLYCQAARNLKPVQQCSLWLATVDNSYVCLGCLMSQSQLLSVHAYSQIMIAG